MPAIVTDTHALVWFLVEPIKLSANAVSAFDQAVNNGESIYISSISLVELCYLIEKGRLSQTVMNRLLAALKLPNTSLDIVFVTTDIALAVEKISRADVPDMPDRIIAATALELGLPLVTRDHKIRTAGIHTIW